MEIGSEIKQKAFKNVFQKAYINLIYTNNYFRDLHNNIFSQKGIKSQHYNLMRITRGHYPNPVTPGYIKEVMLDKGCDVTRLIDKLVALGYLLRKENKLNKRKYDILLTSKGLELTNILETEIEELTHNLQHMTDEEYELLSVLLDKMRG